MATKRTRFAAARRAAGHSQESLAYALQRERSTVARWEAGLSDPVPGARTALARELGVTLTALDELLSEVASASTPAALTHAGVPTVSVAGAAGQTQLRVSEIAAGGVAAGMIDELRSEVGRLAVDYVHAPLWSIFEDLVTTRDLVFGLLDQRQRPDDAHELYLLAGATCLLLAHASHNIGNRPAAFIQLRGASTCAALAGCDALSAWCMGTEALINDGLARPDAAIEKATEGLRFRACGESHAMLAGVKARALARLGDRPGALAAVAQLEGLRERDDVRDYMCGLGGVLSFPPAKQAYYLGSVYGLLEIHGEAERHARAAIRAYETGPPEARSYGDEALARLDVVNARLSAGDVDGGQEALADVLAIPDQFRIRQLEPAMDRTRRLLVPWTRTCSVARDLMEAIDSRYGERSVRR